MSKLSTASSLTALGLLAAAVPGTALSAEAPEELLELEEQVVTGTRIIRAVPETANPIVSYDAGQIAQSGFTNITDFLVDSPALIGSLTTSDTSGSGIGIGRVALNLLNLRNLGTDRTLVLVNGRRHIAGEVGSAAVDINTLPIDLIERIDVQTGGMSAIYGADSVSGVVNFITRRDFTGLSIRGQTGLSELGDGGGDLFAITAGRDFAGGAGNVALSYEFGQEDRVTGFARPRSGDPLQAYRFVRNPDDPDDDPAIHDFVPMNDLRYMDSARNGAFDVDGDLTPDFTGSTDPYDLGIPLWEDFLAAGGSSTPIAGYAGDLRAKTQRHVANLLGNLELSDSLRLFAEAKFARSRAWNTGQPSFDYLTYISEENPLMPATIRDAIVPGGVSSWFSDELGEVVPEGVFMSRDNFDLGARGDRTTRDTLRSVVGLDGHVLGGTRYEVSYTFGQADIEYFGTNNRIEDRYFAALDAVDEGQFLTGTPNGVTRCRIDLQPAGTPINYPNILFDMISGSGFAPGGDGSGTPLTFTAGADSGCVPVNPFGEEVSDAAALDWIRTDARTESRMSHHVVSGSLSGDFGRFMALPGGAIGWAAGAEYRKEKSRSTPEERVQQQVLYGYPLIQPERGSFDVKEAFAEVNLPLLRDAPGAHLLSVGAAVRLADYSTIGNATTWKADALWAPIRDVTFRATYSQAVRAPNIAELFSPVSGTFESVEDPCVTTRQGLGPAPENRLANCAAILTALGLDPDNFTPAYPGSIPGSLGGNRDLTEETARSWTAGFMLTPSFAPALTVTFDWYRTRLNDAVSWVSADELVALCVDAPTLDNPFCESIERNPSTGLIDDFQLLPQNVSRFTVEGADLSLDYTRSLVPGWGEINVRLAAGYLDELTFISTPGAEVQDDRNMPYTPKYMATSDLTWSKGGLAVNLGTSFFSKTRRYDAVTLQAEPDYVDPKYVWYKAGWTHDLQVAYTLRDRNLRIFGGAQNILDAKPAFGSSTYPNGWMGRYFYTGASFTLGR